MKQIFAFASMILVSTSIVSAHGFHAEILEAVDHMQTHLIETGASLIATVLVIAIGYTAYRKMIGTQEKE
jgi:hypothetical protein